MQDSAEDFVEWETCKVVLGAAERGLNVYRTYIVRFLKLVTSFVAR